MVTEESKIVLNQLKVNEEGTYRCLLQDQKGTTLSRMYFKLKGRRCLLNLITHCGLGLSSSHLSLFPSVNPLPSTTPRLIVALPSLPSSYDSTLHNLQRSSLIIILILLTVLSITGSLVIIVNLRYAITGWLVPIKRGFLNIVRTTTITRTK